MIMISVMIYFAVAEETVACHSLLVGELRVQQHHLQQGTTRPLNVVA